MKCSRNRLFLLDPWRGEISMASKNKSRQEPKEVTPTSLYFADPQLLIRIDDLADSTGLSRNKILIHIIASNIGNYEKKPALLLEAT